MSNKLLIVSIALVMVCALHTLIFADGIMPTGLGTATDPFQVATYENLLWAGTNDWSWCKHFIQTADVDAENKETTMGTFTGTYDGQGFIISNLNSPMFGSVEGTTIKNIHLRDYNIMTDNHGVGGLACDCISSVVEGCTVTGTISGDGRVGGLIGLLRTESVVSYCHAHVTVSAGAQASNIGGLIGKQYGCSTVDSCYATGSVTVGAEAFDIGGLIGGITTSEVGDVVSRCYFIGTVTSTGDFVGGLVGYVEYASIDSCYTLGSVTGAEDVGGLVGLCGGSTTNSYSKANITGSEDVGGLIGLLFDCELSCCYAEGSVTGTEAVGGLIGRQYYSSANNCYATGSVTGTTLVGGLDGYDGYSGLTKCYSTGLVTGSSAYGGLIGYRNQSTATRCYWDTETSGQSSSDGGTGKTTAEMKMTSTYIGWDFDDTWNRYVDYNNGYPYLEDNNYFSVEPETGSSCKEMHVLNYPNPVRNRTTISYSIKGIANNETVDVRVFNLKGQLVEHTEATGGSLELNTEHYTSGIYFYKVAHEKKILTGKMMVVK